ncbi:MAG TPA: proton-conducting transporter membrane subunit, partial [Gemmatimonadales bacterium]|nr:proton-conducting transporter membrane subunit [Gemmatimonadales bacterium]
MTNLAAGLALILLAGLLGALLARQPVLAGRVVRWGMSAGCLVGVAAAVSALAGKTGATAGAGFGFDPLSAWFTIVTLGPGAAAAAYGVPYLGADRTGHRTGIAHLMLSVLLVALVGVVTARTTVTFLVAFEAMAVSAYLLVVFEHRDPDVRGAGFLYIVLTHLGVLAIIGMFAAWGGADPLASFDQLAVLAANGRAPVGLILVLGLIGFGIKAGMVPAHFWLPGAHAAAPTHVSALLSGVVLKSGIYGLLRVLSLTGPAPVWWGWSVLLLGLVSAVLGVVWALAQHDLKRLLAYHSVENIGIILMGVGLGALGAAYGQPVVALFGFTGAVLHTLNHALFKSLLFLGAGVVAGATGTREIDRLGGLVRDLPRTAWAFLLGSAAIVGLPPLNGFVSEWILFRGLLEAGGTTGALRGAAVATAGLALTGALALACFAKLYGVVFLGSARENRGVESATERGLFAPQAVLALACLAIGLLPFAVMPAAVAAAAAVLPGGSPVEAARVTAGSTRVSAAALALVMLGLLAWGLRRVVRRPWGREVSGDTWACGYVAVTSRMQYTASSFAASLLGAFGPLAGSEAAARPGGYDIHSV